MVFQRLLFFFFLSFFFFFFLHRMHRLEISASISCNIVKVYIALWDILHWSSFVCYPSLILINTFTMILVCPQLDRYLRVLHFPGRCTLNETHSVLYVHYTPLAVLKIKDSGTAPRHWFFLRSARILSANQRQICVQTASFSMEIEMDRLLPGVNQTSAEKAILKERV